MKKKFQMKKHVILICLAALELISCRQALEWPGQTVIQDKKLLESAASLEMVKTEINDSLIFGAVAFYPAGDKLVAVMPENSLRAFVYIYDRKSGAMLDSLMVRGRGPEEALSCMVSVNGDMLLLDDYVKGELRYGNIDDILAERSLKSYSYRDYRPLITKCPYGDRIIYEIPYCDKIFADRYTEHYPRLKYSADGGIVSEDRGDRYDAYNMSQGYIQVNQEHQRVVYVSDTDDLIEIYDLNLIPLKRIVGPIPFEIKYSGQKDEPSLSGGIPYSYLSVCHDANYFYAAYLGVFADMEFFVRQKSIYNLSVSYIINSSLIL